MNSGISGFPHEILSLNCPIGTQEIRSDNKEERRIYLCVLSTLNQMLIVRIEFNLPVMIQNLKKKTRK